MRDWRKLNLVFVDTCGSVVFARLTQASYNKGRPISQHRNLSYLHLANHIRSITRKKESFSFRNMNIPINFIRGEGLHRDVSMCVCLCFVSLPNQCILKPIIYVCVGSYVWTRRDNQNGLLLRTTCGSPNSSCQVGDRSSWNYSRGPTWTPFSWNGKLTLE